MTTVWQEFGFKQTPYRVTALEANEEDLGLFCGREEESERFLTQMDSVDGALVVVSGHAGIGKTSFVNIQQHLLASGQAGWGQRLLPCWSRTALNRRQDEVTLARSLVHNAVNDIARYCHQTGRDIPKQCEVIQNWLAARPTTVGYQLSIGLAGLGRTWALPPVEGASLETWRDTLQTLATEVRRDLELDGFIICLENAESLETTALTGLLMSYRDELLVIPGIWWVLIGQCGLYRQIESSDARVSQRIKAGGIELSTLTAEQFHQVIERRVRSYRSLPEAVSPLSEKIHSRLFDASLGEIRLVFAMAAKLIEEIVITIRLAAKAALRAGQVKATDASLDKILADALKRALIESRVPDQLALNTLRRIVAEATQELRQDVQTVRRLALMGGDFLRPRDCNRLGFATPTEFESQFLEPQRKTGVLGCPSNASEPIYRLKGNAWLAHSFGMFEVPAGE